MNTLVSDLVERYLLQIVVEASDEGMNYSNYSYPAYLKLRVPESFLVEFSNLKGFRGMLIPGFIFWEESQLVEILEKSEKVLANGNFYINALDYLHGDVDVEYERIPKSGEIRITVKEFE